MPGIMQRQHNVPDFLRRDLVKGAIDQCLEVPFVGLAAEVQRGRCQLAGINSKERLKRLAKSDRCPCNLFRLRKRIDSFFQTGLSICRLLPCLCQRNAGYAPNGRSCRLPLNV